jgi:hypothetical protein
MGRQAHSPANTIGNLVSATALVQPCQSSLFCRPSAPSLAHIRKPSPMHACLEGITGSAQRSQWGDPCWIECDWNTTTTPKLTHLACSVEQHKSHGRDQRTQQLGPHISISSLVHIGKVKSSTPFCSSGLLQLNQLCFKSADSISLIRIDHQLRSQTLAHHSSPALSCRTA